MRDEELIKLKKDYKREIDRLKEIKKLIESKDVKRFIELESLNSNKYKNINYDKVLKEILRYRLFTNTNNIYVITSKFTHKNTYNKIYGGFYLPKIQCRIYRDIENMNMIELLKNESEDIKYQSIEDLNRIELLSKGFDESTSTIESFESKNIILNPFNENYQENGLDEVRQDFFMECIKSNQENAIKLILKKYNRI